MTFLLPPGIKGLIRFQKEQFVLSRDREQMFHQIGVRYSDHDALRFLWHAHMFDPIEGFKMNVLLFGKIDSRCIANWTLQKTVKGNEDQITFRSSRAKLKNFYMGDYLGSFRTTQKGGFKVTKFISNSKKILKGLLPYGVSQKHSIVCLDSQNTSIQRELGVLYYTEILQTHHMYSMLFQRGTHLESL